MYEKNLAKCASDCRFSNEYVFTIQFTFFEAKNEKAKKLTGLRHEMLVVVLLGPGGNCQAASMKSHGGIFFFFSNLQFLFYVPRVFFLLLILQYFRSGCKRLSIII